MWLSAPSNIWLRSMQVLDSIWRPRRDLNPCYRREIISNFQIGNLSYNRPMQGQDIALLLRLAIQDEPELQSKNLAESLFISPSEVSKSLKRCVDAGLLYVAGPEKRVNRSGLMEFLSHGLKYAFPPARGSMVRGVPTAASAEPLKSRLLEDREPPASGRMLKERFAAFRSLPCINWRPKPRCEIPSSTACWPSAMRSAAEGHANGAWPLNSWRNRYMSDPNLPLLEDAVRKLAPFLDEIVFVGGVTLGLLITDEAPLRSAARRMSM